MDLVADRGRRVTVEELNTSKLLAHAAKQARDRKFEDVLIVDCDAHHYENENFGEILPYMENDVLRQLALASRAKQGRGNVMPAGFGYQDMGGRAIRCAPPRRRRPAVSATRRSASAGWTPWASTIPASSPPAC
jgi:hypothetical protein